MEQHWTAHKKGGEVVSFTTPLGYDFNAAIRHAGMAPFEVEFIRPESVAVVPDIRAWHIDLLTDDI